MVYTPKLLVHCGLNSKRINQQKNFFLRGLFAPCPNGKVPSSMQRCFEDGKEWPDVNWVEQQIKENKIDFIGDVLAKYHGISSSDSLIYPYYALAEKYDLPVLFIPVLQGELGPQ